MCCAEKYEGRKKEGRKEGKDGGKGGGGECMSWVRGVGAKENWGREGR